MLPHDDELHLETAPARKSPVAIVGIGCRLPGSANSPDEFWQLLRNGVDAVSEVPADRWSVRKFCHPDPTVPGKLYAIRGGFIHGAFQFDAAFFGISPREALQMDPQQRLVLEAAYEACEDAGLPLERLAGTKTGVYIGISTYEYGAAQGIPSELRLLDGYSNLGGALSLVANRVSYAFDLKGPSLVVDTACSSSLVAVDLAFRSLRDGESTLALVGGVNLLLGPAQTMGFCKASMLSPDGRCNPFDASANGYVRAEGVGVVVLRPLEAAIADGDRIYALITATAVNQDGHCSSIAVPNQVAQEAVLKDAYHAAGIDPRQVRYVEAHGTGTPVGDPIEAAALGKILGAGRDADHPCVIGSVKSNIGHLEAGAGAAGLIKAALCLQHGEIPPTLHFTEANQDIPLTQLGLRVAQTLEAWPDTQTQPRVAGVNSFGFGGTNAHVVLQEAPRQESIDVPHSLDQRAQLLTLSARSQDALNAMVRSYESFLRLSSLDHTLALADICQAAARRRSHLEFRLTVTGRTEIEIADQLRAYLAGETRLTMAVGRNPVRDRPKLAFVFSGMGPQWWGMGRELFDEETIVRDCIQRCDELLHPLAGWSLAEELRRDEETSRIQETRIAQPAIFALQVALSRLWRSWGIEPDAVVGHSVGEVAAAHVSGALTLEDAVQLVFHRSRLQHATEGQGRMLAVGLSENDARRRIEQYRGAVSIAAINGPQSTTLSGDSDLLIDLDQELGDQGVFSRFLQVEVPYHSAALDPYRAEMLRSLAHLKPCETSLCMVSTARPGIVTGDELTADYWWENARNCVCFGKAMEQLAERGCRTFLEISAHPVLAPSMTECLASVTGQTNVLHSLRRHEPELAMILGSLGRLHTIGFPIAWETLFAAPSKFVSLPKYPWQHEYYYRESSEMKRWKSGSGWHPLLGDRQTTSRPTWMAEVTASSPAYLRDHRVQGAVVYPAAAFIEMALAAMAAINGDGVRVLADFTLTQGLVLRESLDVVRLETSFDPAHPTIRFGSRIAGETGEWTPHGSGTVLGKAEAPAPQAISLSDLRDAFGRSVSKKLSYEQLKEVGLEYGPAFQGIERVWFGDGEGLGEICVENHKDWGNYELFPPLFDACFQVALLTRFHATADGDAARGLYLPVSIGRLTWRRKATGRVWCHVQLGRRRKGAFSVDLQLFDETGRVIAEALDARCRSLGQLPNDLKSPAEDYLARYSWRVKPLNGSGPDFEPKDFLPMSDSLARQVRDRLEDRSEELERHKHHQEVTPRLNALLAAMITSTFRELGWRPEVSDVVSESSLAERLGVPKCRRGLLTRLLWFLQERSFLRETTEGWSVAAVLPSESSEVCFHGLLQSYPAYLSELSLLRRLGLKLPALLRGEIGAADVFETAELAPLIEQFRLDAPTNRIWNLTLHDVVSNLAAQLPKGRTLRILEYGFNADRASAHDNPRQASRDTSPVLASPGDGLQTSRSMAADSSSIRTVRVTWTNDLVEQGVELASFDVLLLPEGLPAAGSRASALERLRPLLGNGALVVALEPTRTGNWTDFALELLSPPSAPPPPAESGGARRSTEECCSRLRDAGFEDVTAISEPAVSLDHCLLLARHLAGVPDPICNGRAPAEERPIQSWLILSDESRLCEHLADEIRRGGQTPIVATPGDDFVAVDATGYRLRPGEPDDMRQLMSEVAARHEPCGGVIHCWSPCIACEDSLTSADLENAQRRGCVSVLHLVQAIEAVRWTSVPRLIVVTRGAASIGNTPANSLLAAPLVGLARVVMHEHPHLQTRVIDLDDSPEADEAGMVLAELASEDREDEVAYRSGIRYVHRLQRIPRKQLARLPQALQEIGATTEDCAQLTVRTTGILDSLSFESVPRRSPGPGEVEIRVAAAALNFKDVAKAMGLLSESTLEGTASGWSLGLECSGTVTVVGEGVTRYQVGDDVVGFAAHSLGSHAIADVRLLSRRPPHLNHEEAATLTLVSMTAHYALHHLARVRAGERILIHSAAGGVGLAAIQLAFRDGVEVFATAGSSEKREYLRSIGVPHVMDSRSLAFADAIRELTGGRGVDVVLNSLGGEVISRSLALLAPFGRFVELGKRDIERNEVLGLKPFQDNLSFFAADLDRLCVERPELAELICREVAELISDGTLTPLPYRVFPASRIVEAFRHMANARHVGKVIITMQDVEQLTGLPGRELQLPPAATYLVTGGLSGFGLVTAQWLAERGARHLVLMGRSGASTKEARQAIQDLERRGVNVVVAKADVSDAAQVRQALSKLRASMPPLRGVIHSAMVLDDGVLLQLDADRIDRVLNPKVKGAWNLHELTRNEDLDFFVMYSSVASLIGNPGQANYAAANAFLDELCRYRRSLGLPALTVNWGAIADVGVAARSAVVQDHFERLGINSLPPRTALSLLEQLLQRDIVQTAVSPPSDWSRWARLFPGLSSPRFVDIVQTVSSTEGGTEGIDRIREQLVAARPEERGPILESHLRRGLAAVLGASPEKLDVDRPLIDLGLDSLMMVEILTRIRQDLDVEVPPIKFMEGVNLRELAEYLLEELAGGPAVSDAMTVSH